jgi:tetratricopeptide (TPR) repeat protein
VTGPFGRFEFKSMMLSKHCSGYALTCGYAPEARTESLLVAANEVAQVWLNDRVVVGRTTTRNRETSDSKFLMSLERVPVSLRQGRNRTLVKVSTASGDPSLRLLFDDGALDQASPALAHAREALKNSDRSTYDHDLALLLDPNQPRLYLARGRRLAELGRWEQAEADVAKAVSLKQKDMPVWTQRAIIYAEFDRAEQAADDFLKALDLSEGGEAAAEVTSALVRRDVVFDRVTRLRPREKALWEARL